MTRTPLARALRNLFRDHDTARKLGVPVDAAREIIAEKRDRSSGITRRGLLAGAGLGIATAALPRAAQGSGAPEVAIVGGGIAGLTCALKLADRGIHATVYEGSGRIGGRMFSNTSSYFGQNQVTEWLGELIDSNHTTMRRLAHRFSLPLDNLLDAQPAGSEDTFRFFNAYYPKSQADLDFAPVYNAVVADEASAPFPTTFDRFTAAGQALDQLSIYDWIESRVPGGHSSALGALLDTAYNIEYGADTRDQSALSLIYVLGFQPDPPNFSVFGESDERFHVRGGNQQVPLAIAASLGNAVHTGQRLVRIRRTSGQRYRLTFDAGASSRDVVADYVVLALPFAVLSQVDYTHAGFDALKIEAIEEQGRGKNGKLQVQFSARLWNQTGAWPGISTGSTFSDAGYQGSWEATRGQASTKGVMVLYSGAAAVDAKHATTAFGRANNAGVAQDALIGVGQLDQTFPGVAALYEGKAIQALPHLSEFFRLAYSYYRVGQFTSIAGYEKKRQGGVLFCGEHTSLEYQGFMEGGAAEGKRAARQLARIIRGWDDMDDSV